VAEYLFPSGYYKVVPQGLIAPAIEKFLEIVVGVPALVHMTATESLAASKYVLPIVVHAYGAYEAFTPGQPLTPHGWLWYGGKKAGEWTWAHVLEPGWRELRRRLRNQRRSTGSGFATGTTK